MDIVPPPSPDLLHPARLFLLLSERPEHEPDDLSEPSRATLETSSAPLAVSGAVRRRDPVAIEGPSGPETAADIRPEYLQRSGLPLQASKLTTLYLAPIRDHVAQRYRQKLLPRLRFLAAQSRQAYSTLTHSALVRTLKTDYLPLLNRFLHHNILRPLRQSVLPNLLNFYQIHLHPHLISLARSSYQTLFINDNPLKNQLKTLKLTYRNRLLRPVKALHSIYVKPQIRKIVLKLNEYNHNRNSSSSSSSVINTTTTSPIVHQEKVDHQPIPPSVDDDHHHHASAIPSSSAATDDDREIPAPSLSGADDEDLVQPVIEPVREQEQDKVQATSTDTFPIHAQEQEESKSIVEQVSLDHLPSVVEEHDEPACSSPLDTSSPPSSSSPSDDHDLVHDQVEAQVESDDGVEESELLPGEIEDDNLTVDVDEFMNEIDDELASTTSSSAPTPASTEPQEGEGEEEEEGGARGRHGPAEIAAQRRDLEALSAELLAKIRETEATQIPALIELLNGKRSAERVSELDELVDREKKPQAIQKEMARLLERVVKWFDRAETKLGSVLSTQNPEDPGPAKNTIDEQIVQADLVRNKALQKVDQRLVSVYLLQLARFKQAQLRLETDHVFEPLWNPVGLFFDSHVARLGHGLTWLSDVTYHDWAVYNRINREVALVKRKLESIMVNGTIPSSSSSSTTVTVSDRAEEPEDPELEDDPTNPDDADNDGDGDGEERKEEEGQEEMIKQRLIRPSFYREIEATEALVDRIHRRFQADLDARYRRFLDRLHQLGRSVLAPHLEDPLVEQNQEGGGGRTDEARSIGMPDLPTQDAQTPSIHADRDEL
ncbi:uncharacterized protein PGTG_16771 [Puccinia graminis f. sp. tritici CRL 75-36-700-3]|uniref:Uncharacterized protein n=1 Tax=Puccinia graminis f. sp. tritici (strain CRL 75-36-700-3 / race SCCL) TaxID=418459 RepID=E3L2F8_PUCGT|nr:uncharacterized protein PGTG_16771 [Puccinia graminis f. sp. tritici CRL 75-36-700-3]EFP90745.1 hypothetical protein PGTG_16771 [Puccinia graminis f. sp. tritici CRL 75-36-700-3]